MQLDIAKLREGIDMGLVKQDMGTARIAMLQKELRGAIKQLNDEKKGSLQKEENLKSFLLEKTSAIKRPIFEQNGQYLAGFDSDKLENWLNT